MSEVFAKKDLLDRVDGDTEFLEETVAMLDEDCPALLEKIRTAVASNDAQPWQESVSPLRVVHCELYSE